MDHLTHKLRKLQLADRIPRCAAVAFSYEDTASTLVSSVSFDSTTWNLRESLTFFVRATRFDVWPSRRGERWGIVQDRLSDLLKACGARTVFVYGDDQYQLLKKIPGLCCDVIDLAAFAFCLNGFLKPAPHDCGCDGTCMWPRAMLNWFLSCKP